MGVKVSFLGNEAQEDVVAEVQGVMISGEALRADADGDFVWLIRGSRVERRSIVLGGARDRPQVLVSSGLVAGDTIVRSADGPLTGGQNVTTQ